MKGVVKSPRHFLQLDADGLARALNAAQLIPVIGLLPLRRPIGGLQYTRGAHKLGVVLV